MSRSTPCSAAIGVWFIFLAVAFAFGAVRELVLVPLIGRYAAHVIGTLIVIAAFLGVMAAFVRRVRGHCTPGDFWWIGLLWFVMTAAFEFLFFHYVGGRAWEELLADYNVARGRIWSLVLLTTLFGPPAIDSIFRWRSTKREQDA